MNGPEDLHDSPENFHKGHSVTELGGVLAYPVAVFAAPALLVWAYTFGPLGRNKSDKTRPPATSE